MKAITLILGTYVAVGAFGLVLYVLSFQVPFGGEILFYRGLVLAGMVAVIIMSALALVAKRFRLAPATIIGAAFSSLALNVCFLVVLPVTVDRSISVFLLTRIEDEQPIKALALQQAFIADYVVDMEQIERRVREQELSGNVIVTENGIVLTERGRRFNALARYASVWFSTDRRLLQVKEPPAGYGKASTGQAYASSSQLPALVDR